MEVILLTDVEKVGNKLEIITVKPGFGRNYLIPRKLAMVANKSNRAKIDDIKAKEAEVAAATLGDAKILAAKIKAATLKIGAKAGTSGKIFGSVTNVQLAAALKDQLGIEVDRRSIVIGDEVKELGTYSAKVNIHPQLDTSVAYEVYAD